MLVEICRFCLIFVCVSAPVIICVYLLKGLVGRLDILTELTINTHNILSCTSCLHCYIILWDVWLYKVIIHFELEWRNRWKLVLWSKKHVKIRRQKWNFPPPFTILDISGYFHKVWSSAKLRLSENNTLQFHCRIFLCGYVKCKCAVLWEHAFFLLAIIPFEEVVYVRSSYFIHVQDPTRVIKDSLTRYASTSYLLNEMKSYSLLSPDPSVCAHWLCGVCDYLSTSFLMLLLLHNTESNIYLTVINMGYILYCWLCYNAASMDSVVCPENSSGKEGTQWYSVFRCHNLHSV